MERLGGFFVLFGVLSGLLHLINYELRLLFWVDTWGEPTGWAIRGALVAVGLILVLLGFQRRTAVRNAATLPVQGQFPAQGGFPPQGQYPPQGQFPAQGGFPPQG